MLIWKYLHILAMFSSVTLLVGGDVFFHALRRSGDMPALRRFLAAINPLFMAGVGLLTLGVVFGLVAAATGSWSFTAGWLIVAYVLILCLYLVGLTVGLPYYRGAAAALAGIDEPPGPEALRALADRRGVGSMVASIAGYVAIIFLMVVKPFP